MNNSLPLESSDGFGVATAADTVRVERLLPGPVERLWRYLTEPALRAQWLCDGAFDLRVGGAVELVFRNNSLSAGDDPPPARYAGVADHHVAHGHILDCEPPRLLSYTWSEESGNPSQVRCELTPQGANVLLVVTHSRLAGRDAMLSVSGGWHTHLAILRARLEGRAAPPFWRTFSQLEAEYSKRL